MSACFTGFTSLTQISGGDPQMRWLILLGSLISAVLTLGAGTRW